MGRLLAYLICSIPAAIGVWFLADAAHSTSDSGAASAAQLGLVAAAAYVGPLLALIVWRNGYKIASAVLWLLTAGAMVANLSQTLDALANRGAGKNAEAAKLAATVRADRATLKRLSEERQALRFTAADAEAVKAAQAAVASAERSKNAECENRGRNCRLRETEEQAKRDALAKVLEGKALTDQAAKLDVEIGKVTARLDKAPPVRETQSGNLFVSIFSLSPITAASFQQQVFAALIEAIIAASLCMPELLRPKHSPRREEKTTEPAPEATTAPIEPAKPRLVSNASPAASIIDFAATHLERAKGGKLEFDDFYMAYVAACSSAGERALMPDEAIGPTERVCRECDIKIKSVGANKYLMGVRLKTPSSARPTSRLGSMTKRG